MEHRGEISLAAMGMLLFLTQVSAGTVCDPTNTKTWLGGFPDNANSWFVHANWAEGIRPAEGDTVLVLDTGFVPHLNSQEFGLQEVVEVCAMTINPGAGLDLGGGNTQLKVTTTFVNHGRIAIGSAVGSGVILDSVEDMLHITATGEMLILPNGPRSLRGHILNEGTVTLRGTTSYGRTGDRFINRGTMIIDPAVTFDLSPANGGVIFEQDAGVLTIDGELDIVLGTFDFNGGQMTGAPTLVSSILDIAPDATSAASPATMEVRATSEIVSDIPEGSTIRMTGGNGTLTANAGLVNDGSLHMEPNLGANAVLEVTGGALTNNGLMVADVGGGGGNRIFRATVINNGTLTINRSASLTATDGVFDNLGEVQIAAGATLSMASGGDDKRFNQTAGLLDVVGDFVVTGGRFSFMGGTIQGTVHVSSALLDITASTPGTFRVTGASTFGGNVAQGQMVDIDPGGNGSLTADNGFSNAGHIRLHSNSGMASLRVLSGVLDNSGMIHVADGGGSRVLSGSFDNSGTLLFERNTTMSAAGSILTNTGQVTIAPGTAVSMSSSDNSHAWRQDAGTLDVLGDLTITGGTLAFNGGMINGLPRLSSGALAISATTPGSVVTTGASTFSGNIAAGQLVDIGTGGNTTLTASTGFANAGEIRLDTTSGNAVLTVSDGTLTNTGTILVAGSGGSRTVNAVLDNQGLLRVERNLTLSRRDVTHVNTGTIDIQPGITLSLPQDAGAEETVFSSFGPDSLTGGGTLDVRSSVIHARGGMSIDLVNRNAALRIGQSPGSLTVTGAYQENNQLSSIELEIGGTEPGTGHDHLHVEGLATLRGPINVSLVDGFVPQRCQRFDVITWTSRSADNFAVNGIDLPSLPDLELRPLVLADRLVLMAVDSNAPVSLGEGPVDLAEGGGPASYPVCLGAAPADAVIVTALGDAQSTLTPSTLDFTPGVDDGQVKWVELTAVDDDVFEGFHTSTINHVSSSNDASFDNLLLPEVIAYITDNDPGPPVDLVIDIANATRLLPGGQSTSYSILVFNGGPNDVIGARVLNLLPAELSNPVWTCQPQGGAACNAMGTSEIDELVDLPVGDSVEFTLSVSVQALPEVPITQTVSVTEPFDRTETQPADNTDSETDDVGVFFDSFEDLP